MLNNILSDMNKGHVYPVTCKSGRCNSSSCHKIGTELVLHNRKKLNYLFVMPTPDIHEGYTKHPFSSVTGMTVRNIICRLKEKHNQNFSYGFTYLCKEAEVYDKRRNRIERAQAMANCLPIFIQEVKRFKPVEIVLMGMEVITTLFPHIMDSIHKLRGNYYQGPDMIDLSYNPRFYFTHNPNSLMIDPVRLGDLYQDLDYLFGRKRPKINITYGKNTDSKKYDRTYHILQSPRDIRNTLVSMYYKENPVVLDIETTSLGRLRNTILTFQLSNGGDAYIIPWGHPENKISPKGLELVRNLLRWFFDGQGHYPFVVGHNLKFDYGIPLNTLGIEIKTPLMDTMACAFLLDETHTKDDDGDDEQTGVTGGYGLGSQLYKYGYREEWYFDAKKNRANLATESLDYVAQYGGGDVVLNYELLRCLYEEAKLQDYVEDFDRFLLKFYSEQVKFFTELESNGVAINLEYLGKLMSEDSPLLKYKEKVIKELCDKPTVKAVNQKLTENQKSLFGDLWLFDPNKPDHMQMLFFDEMDIAPLEYSKKTGKPSMNKDFKKAYRSSIREVKLYSELIRVKQLFSLYPKSFYNKLAHDPDCMDGRIRPTFKGTHTQTGRGSSADPNTQQNVSKTDEEESPLVDIVRGVFTSDPGNILVKLDIMANEIRCWGTLAKDPKILEAVMQGYKLRQEYFKKGPDKALAQEIKIHGDFHRFTAALFLGKSIKDITDVERGYSKSTTFGTVYGLSDDSLSNILGLSIEEVRQIKKDFFNAYAKGKKWLDNSVRTTSQRLYCETPLGRRRRLWHFLVTPPLDSYSIHKQGYKLNYKNKRYLQIHGMGARRAQNTPVQALGSDIAFIGSFLMRRAIKKHNRLWRLYNVVHDSLEAEIPVTDIADYVLTAKVVFEQLTAEYIKKHFNYDLYVPVEVDFEIGFEGNQMQKWDGALKSLYIMEDYFKEKNQERIIKYPTANKPSTIVF